MAITSDDVNYLVYRYLLESGFSHSTFAFSQEASVHTRDYIASLTNAGTRHESQAIKPSRVPPGALIYYLQKGLQYEEVETHTMESILTAVAFFGSTLFFFPYRYSRAKDGVTMTKCSAPFSLTHPHECVINESSSHDDQSDAANADKSDTSKQNSKKLNATANVRKEDSLLSKRERKEAKRAEREKKARKESSSGVATAMEGITTAEEDESLLQTASDVTIYKPTIDPARPVGAVYCVGWNPRFMLLAAGSQDGRIRLWRVPPDSSEGIMTDCAVTLDHASADEENGVTCLDWHPQGLMIATGSVGGSVKIWQKSGDLKHTLARHKGTVFSLRFNKKGDLLGTVSSDATVIIWDSATGELRQQFECHESPVLDIDWKDDITFATCSSDKYVYVCRMGMLEPLRVFSGHGAEVNAIQWDATNQLLASCSDDGTIKVWAMETNAPLFNLTGHKQEVFCLRWAPNNPSAANATGSTSGVTATTLGFPQNRMLASGSFDNAIRIWDATSGRCVQILERHTLQVSALCFSADGCFLASGGFDNVFNVWRTRDWALVKSFKGNGNVFEVAWGVKGDKVSVCFHDGVVAVVHLAGLRDKQ
ncbi:WD40-repeat-containing domain protein [Chytriomyces cf. hyalinus JEL632]|nr:WD40-repeat-containing domain protein [Chytriomyces cf. hyalinus JEL632]